MSKKAPLIVELGLGLFLTALVAWSYHAKTPLLETVSLKTYDTFYKFLQPSPISDSIRIVEVDDASVSALGRWPWPRSLLAQLLDSVVEAGGKVIGVSILLVDPDQSAGLEQITSLHEKFFQILEKNRPSFKKKKADLKDFEAFLENDLSNAVTELNSDSTLAQTIEQATNIILPMYFVPGDVLGNNLEPLKPGFMKQALPFKADSELSHIPPGKAAVLPLDDFANATLAIGHCNLIPDVDGSLRRVSPLFRYGETVFPSFGLELVREYLQLERSSIKWDPGVGLTVGKANIPLDSDGRIYLKLAGPAGTIHRISAVDVMSGAVPEKMLEGKIVLVGLSTTGQGETYTGPGGERLTGLEIWANHIENILGQQFISRPSWAEKAEWGFIGLAALLLLSVLPLVRARFSIPLCLIVFLGMLGTSFFLFTKQGMWVSPAFGASLLLAGFALITGKRLIFTEKKTELMEADSMETNKMLGLSFQGQGMLDLAFEKFRRCEVDDSMKDVLYNLGLDMERKRQFTKAAAVYEHISTVDAKYKDIKDKIELLKKAGEGAIFGGVGKKGSDSTVVVDGLGQFTTLGRYEVQKELGRGAMGIVYLGKDPKINRQVAIKTLRFEDDMDEEQTKSIKERFFREAESAGNLTHPNIIRIFDAGEDQDVAYIAMELLEGHDLKRYTDKNNLLPLEQAVEMIIQVANGLDYAHKQGVIHRDVKPANIMLLKDGSLRITDFGIARIQASSKTATGAVLGTPAYMSPEQVNGSKKLDGRADLFSLGVTLYELLTGEKPFSADSIAALLYRIANVEHTDPREYNKDLPSDLVNIITKCLAKDPANRFQTAEEMSQLLSLFLRRWRDNPASTNQAPVVKPEKPKIIPPPPVPKAPAPAPAAPAQKPLAPAPTEVVKDVAFLSELEEAFNLTQSSEGKAPSPLPTSPEIKEPAAEDTLEKTLEKTAERTAEKPGAKEIDTIILPGPGEIEHNFEPPIPGTTDEPKKGNAKFL